MLGRLFPLAWSSPEPPRGVGCSEGLSCPWSSEASSWDAGQCSPLFLSSWFLQGARGSTAASTVLQAPRGRTERECVRPQSQPETGEVAPPRTSEVGSSASAGGGRWVPPTSPTTWRPAGFSPPTAFISSTPGRAALAGHLWAQGRAQLPPVQMSHQLCL